jgi:uncharacterized protein DUF4168
MQRKQARMSSRGTLKLAAVLVALGLCGYSSTPAQASRPPASEPELSAIELTEPSPNLSDETLDKAAAALDRVTSILQNYKEQIESAPQSDQARLASETKGALEKAVNDEGLSIEEYTAILQVAQVSPEIRQRLLRRIDPTRQ